MTVMLATFMEVLDTTVVNVCLPHMAGDLGASTDEATWGLTAYLVSNAIILPMGGWFSMLMGRKRFYMLCVALFTISSFLCGIAPTLGTLILFRIMQGIGGGALQPVAQAILVESFPLQKRGMAMAVFGIGVVFAPIIGPTPGRLDHGQLQLALGFLHQYPLRRAVPPPDSSPGLRPALPEAQGPQRTA